MDQWEKNMFGYISIYEPELKMKDFRRYKAYYCGLCKALKEQFGRREGEGVQPYYGRRVL